jgi:hypothetical protein
MRVRAFTQDDAHIFCTEDQLEAEILKINDLMMSVYKDFGFEEVVVKLATRPEKRVGTDAMWDHAEEILKRSLERMAREDNRIKTGINEGEGTFYGPKFEYTLRMPLAANGNAAPRRSTSTCRSALEPSTSAPIGKEAAGDGASRHLRLAGTLPASCWRTIRAMCRCGSRLCRSSSRRSLRTPTSMRPRS